MQSFKEFIQNDILHEASLGRFYQHYDKGEPILIISASRDDVLSDIDKRKIKDDYIKNHPKISDEKEIEKEVNRIIAEEKTNLNNKRSKEMRTRYIQNAHFGYNIAIGYFKEDNSESPSYEESIIVYSDDRKSELFNLGKSLAKKYKQDSFGYIENKILKIYNSDGIQIDENKNFHPNKLADAMTILKGKKITFDNIITEEYKIPQPTGFISGLALRSFRKILSNPKIFPDPVAEYDRRRKDFN